MLSQLVYASSAVDPLGPDDLVQIVRASRRNNAADGVTGVLAYHGGNIMQAIEGPEPAVDALFSRIQADPRHRGVLVLYRSPVDARSFPDWTMGLVAPEAPAGVEGVQDVVEVTASRATRAHRLLNGFRALVGR